MLGGLPRLESLERRPPQSGPGVVSRGEDEPRRRPPECLLGSEGWGTGTGGGSGLDPGPSGALPGQRGGPRPRDGSPQSPHPLRVAGVSRAHFCVWSPCTPRCPGLCGASFWPGTHQRAECVGPLRPGLLAGACCCLWAWGRCRLGEGGRRWELWPHVGNEAAWHGVAPWRLLFSHATAPVYLSVQRLPGILSFLFLFFFYYNHLYSWDFFLFFLFLYSICIPGISFGMTGCVLRPPALVVPGVWVVFGTVKPLVPAGPGLLDSIVGVRGSLSASPAPHWGEKAGDPSRAGKREACGRGPAGAYRHGQVHLALPVSEAHGVSLHPEVSSAAVCRHNESQGRRVMETWLRMGLLLCVCLAS